MLVFIAALIFHEIERLGDLADIVVIGAHPGQERVGVDGTGRGLGHGADHHAVVIGARGLQNHLLQEGMIQVGQLQEVDVGGIAENPLHERAGFPETTRAATNPPRKPKRRLNPLSRDIPAVDDQALAENRQDVHQADLGPGFDEGGPILAIAHAVGADHAADEEINREEKTVLQQPAGKNRSGHGKNQRRLGIEEDTHQHGPGRDPDPVHVGGRGDLRKGLADAGERGPGSFWSRPAWRLRAG